MYSDSEGAIAGREVPGIHVFPLCDRHHKIAHLKRYWRKGRTPPPTLDSRNTPEFYETLQQGWREKIK
ncbi:hypothetical protein [Iningainema tapete]|uniref:Uncharacterized protein n=1 Tax=Iningainema tapete BLCC-T55 TaxID=2748662 RepID=A0A8J7BW48_9CYAN|nr:hypothetical protein [Iningainema tapete]MBD2771122.1 hypothetical protein [Iningainema tapete BLCC-T55]